MNRISRKWLISAGAALALLAVVWLVGTALAQAPDGPDGALIGQTNGSPTESFTYQGRLLDSGLPANGTYEFRYSVYDDANLGDQHGSTVTHTETVTNGVFSTYVQPGDPAGVFTGGPRWLQVEVRPSGSMSPFTPLPRQPIVPTPYAWSLQPGAIISGTAFGWSSGLLNIHNDHDWYPALYAESATASAVNAWSPGGIAVVGSTDDGYAVAGWDYGSEEARGYGGYFSSNNGAGVYGRSLASPSWNNLFAPGVWGESYNGVGVYGVSNDSTNSRPAVYAFNDGTGAGLRAESESSNPIEGYDYDAPDLSELVFRVTNGGEVYADGGYHCGKASGCWTTGDPADMAEVLPVGVDAGPGDVLVVGPDGTLARATQPGDTRVVGVFSSRPMLIGGGENLDQEGYAPLAVVGLVPVKASAENGLIQPGDLLSSASTPGHAMKADPNPPVGTVIGKALEPLDTGTGTIQMLVMLQ